MRRFLRKHKTLVHFATLAVIAGSLIHEAKLADWLFLSLSIMVEIE